MLEFIKYMAQSLVDKPDEVEITETENEDSIVYELHVSPDDMGKVIGRQGRIAKALRTLVKAATPKDSKPVFVEIV